MSLLINNSKNHPLLCSKRKRVKFTHNWLWKSVHTLYLNGQPHWANWWRFIKVI